MANFMVGVWASLYYIIWLLGQKMATAQAHSEGQILIEFRKWVSDDMNALEDWQETRIDGKFYSQPCNWTGVECSLDGYVTGIDLARKGLISREIHLPLCELPNLTSLQLQENDFSGLLPAELWNCTKLEHLNLGANNLTGAIPAETILPLESLLYLNLSSNVFTGNLPRALGRLRNLQTLDLGATGLIGSLPLEIGNLVNLQHLILSWNLFSPGSLPDTFRGLQQLRYFECAGCSLNGTLPLWLGTISHLEYFDLSNNLLTGIIPLSMMCLQNLKWLELFKNKITGQIPSEIWNLTSLTDLDISDNELTGFIPEGLARLENLAVLHLQKNSFQGPIPPAIANLRKLYDVKLYMNKLNGTLPPTLGSNCTLLQFDVSNNNFHGRIPSTLCSQGVLWRLILFNNSFTSNLPDSFGNCSSLIRIRIFGNQLSGMMPDGVWGLPNLSLLEIFDNQFEGIIPETIANATNLSSFKINNNKFSGHFPCKIGQLKKIERLHAHQNNFTGIIPIELGNLGSSVTSLYLDGNLFEGPLPVQLSSLNNLVYLGLGRNRLTGSLPAEFGALDNLIYLDISYNALSGDLSKAMEHFEIDHFMTFNCSYNRFSGKLLVINSANKLNPTWFAGNPNLCMIGANSTHYQCHDLEGATSRSTKQQATSIRVTYISGCLIIITLAFVLVVFLKIRDSNNQQKDQQRSRLTKAKHVSPWSMTLFHQMTIRYKELIECLVEDNIIGSGGGGVVYGATLKTGQQIAIKKLWEDGKGMALHDHGFKAEVDTLGSIRHRNIVKLLCCCSSFSCNLLVYEYMPHGSLGDLLHVTKDTRLSDWNLRCKIAVGAAQGLAYLHHDCVPQILHRDIKSNNILLDNEYEAHIADFGLAKNLDDISMSVIAGSYGYIAPEYAYTLQVDEKSDVYSFGVVLLELVTGRRPIELEFGDGMDIVKWASRNSHEGDGVAKIFDRNIAINNRSQIAQMFQIAIACTQSLPQKRPTMRKVTELLIELHKWPDVSLQ